MGNAGFIPSTVSIVASMGFLQKTRVHGFMFPGLAFRGAVWPLCVGFQSLGLKGWGFRKTGSWLLPKVQWLGSVAEMFFGGVRPDPTPQAIKGHSRMRILDNPSCRPDH